MTDVIDLTLEQDGKDGDIQSSIIYPTTPVPDLHSHSIPTIQSPTRQITGLSPQDHRILLKKQEWLRNNILETPRGFLSQLPVNSQTVQSDATANPTAATLVFAQQEAGTAVCISPSGILLTCSHCVAEDESQLLWSQTHWLIFSSGDVVGAKTIAWDAKRDLALLMITKTSSKSTMFPYSFLSADPPKISSKLLCIGHPAAEDLEAPLSGTKTGYDTLVLSTGKFHGLAAEQDPHNNEEIGALMHSCWTYWGHSGAPLVDGRSGSLIGLHSSWDDQTGMRRGIPFEALLGFLQEVKEHFQSIIRDDWVWYICR